MKGKTVVADASTLIGLSRIEQLVLLRDLYGEIVIPQSVYDEVVTESKHGSERIKAAKYLKVEKVSDSKGVELLLGYLGGAFTGWERSQFGLDISSGNSYSLRRIISHSQRRTRSNVVSVKYLKRHSLPAIYSGRNEERQSGAG